MKRKISISLSEETLDRLDGIMSDEAFRNKSHIIELAVSKFIKEKENERNS